MGWEAHSGLAQELVINKKNPQFLPNQADIQVNLFTHGSIILTKFHNYWVKIEDFFYL